jgi:hypothetical protein
VFCGEGYAVSIISGGKVSAVLGQRRIEGAIAVISAFDERPNKELCATVKKLLEFVQYASGLPCVTLSLKGEKVERWHKFLGFIRAGEQDGFDRYVFQPNNGE